MLYITQICLACSFTVTKRQFTKLKRGNGVRGKKKKNWKTIFDAHINSEHGGKKFGGFFDTIENSRL